MGEERSSIDIFADLAADPPREKKHGTKYILKDLVNYLKRKPEKKRSPGFHVSQLYDMCPRKEAFARKYDQDTEEEISPHLHLIFEVGHAIHERFQNGLLGDSKLLLGLWRDVTTGKVHPGEKPESDGQWEYREPGMRLRVEGTPDEPEWNIVGNCDGILRDGVTLELVVEGVPHQGFVLEAKSCGKAAWAELWRGYDGLAEVGDWVTACGEETSWGVKYARAHAFQSGIYAVALGQKPDYVFQITSGHVKSITGSVVLYVDKETKKNRDTKIPMKEFFVPRDEKYLDAASKKVRQVYQYTQDGTLPDRVCDSFGCDKACECPFVTECFSQD